MSTHFKLNINLNIKSTSKNLSDASVNNWINYGYNKIRLTVFNFSEVFLS